MFELILIGSAVPPTCVPVHVGQLNQLIQMCGGKTHENGKTHEDGLLQVWEPQVYSGAVTSNSYYCNNL